MDLFQARGMGVHWKIEAIVEAMPYAVTIATITQQAKRKGF
jgi:hypothetical protein